MKIIKALMLTLLVSVCAVAMVITGIIIFGGGSSNDAPLKSTVADSDVPEDTLLVADMIEEEEEDKYRFWQRVATKSEETGLYHYYPVIPWDVLPGETAVLSVSATGFMGWDVDPGFAYVELFDEKTGEENAYVSFIMPDEKPSIAALYEGEIPEINDENQNEMIMAYLDMHEHGNVPVPMSTGAIVPRPGTPQLLDDQFVGQQFYISFSNPSTTDIPVNPGKHLRFNWDLSSPTLDGIGWAVTRDVDMIPNGGRLEGEPTTVGTVVFSVAIEQWDTATNTLDGERDTFWFRITIQPNTGEPSIITTSIPAAMVGVYYDTPLAVANFTPGTWVLAGIQHDDFTDKNVMDTGLNLWRELPNGSNWAIQGTPTQAALTGGGVDIGDSTGTPGVYRFIISLARSGVGTESIVLPTQLLTLKVWPQPVITPFTATVTTPAELFDGIANTNKNYEVRLDASGDAIAATSWTWSIHNTANLPPDIIPGLPTGLGTPTATITNSAVTITGRPTQDGEFGFTVRYTANPSVLIGEVVRDYRITIIPPPHFITQNLPDAMDTRGDSSEPIDRAYDFSIRAGGFPINPEPPELPPPTRPLIDWKWSVDATKLPHSNPDFDKDPMRLIDLGEMGTIRGMPTADDPDDSLKGKTRDYPFTIEINAISPGNPNIDKAVIAQEYNIRVWARRYLNIVIDNGEDIRGFIRRATVPDLQKPGEEIVDTDWTPSSWDGNPYRYRRAVMPGTDGEIRVPALNGFVRWEVIENPVDSNDDDLPNSNSYASIGNRWRLQGSHGFTLLKMPDYTSGGANADGDVYIKAVSEFARSPVWSQSANLGVEGDEDSSGFVSLADADLGDGGRSMSWVDVTVPDPAKPFNIFPPGMEFFTGNSRTSIITSKRGGPTAAGIYTFTLGLNLPGSMRIDREFTMLVDENRLRLGDVNGDGQLNLADLVLLTRFVNRQVSSLPNPEAGNIISQKGEDPHGGDLEILSRYFSQPTQPPLDTNQSTPPQE